MPFVKGQSGNPSGRPRLSKEAKEAKELAAAHCSDAVNRLIDLMNNAADERVQKSAADSILDRGIGKPVQTIAGDPDAPLITIRADELSDDALAAYVSDKSTSRT